MAIPSEHLHSVCRIHTGRACALIHLNGKESWSCAKGTVEEERLLRERGPRSPAKQTVNCSGPPDFIPSYEPPL